MCKFSRRREAHISGDPLFPSVLLPESRGRPRTPPRPDRSEFLFRQANLPDHPPVPSLGQIDILMHANDQLIPGPFDAQIQSVCGAWCVANRDHLVGRTRSQAGRGYQVGTERGVIAQVDNERQRAMLWRAPSRGGRAASIPPLHGKGRLGSTASQELPRAAVFKLPADRFGPAGCNRRLGPVNSEPCL